MVTVNRKIYSRNAFVHWGFGQFSRVSWKYRMAELDYEEAGYTYNDNCLGTFLMWWWGELRNRSFPDRELQWMKFPRNFFDMDFPREALWEWIYSLQCHRYMIMYDSLFVCVIIGFYFVAYIVKYIIGWYLHYFTMLIRRGGW